MSRSSTIMPDLLAVWIKLLVPDKCFEEFFIDFNIINVSCYKLVLSKMLGYYIVFSSMMVKVPQIMKIWNAKSAEGISPQSLLLELLVLSSGLSYCARSGFPFSTYGELIFIAFQSSLLLVLVLNFQGKSSSILPLCLGLTFTVCLLVSPAVPMSVLTMLQAGNTVLGLIGKINQIVVNYLNGSTGLLSSATIFMFLFNGIARIYTSVQEVGDMMVIFNYSMVTLCNCVIAGQVIFYWNVPVGKKNENDKTE